MIKSAKKVMTILMTSFLAIALTAGLSVAADKLVVEDGSANKVFSVDDTGKVIANQIGASTSNPLTALHVASDSGTDPRRGILSAQHNDGPQAAYVQFMKSRGSEAAPTATTIGDYIGFFDTQVYTGTSYVNAAGFGFIVDGTVTSTDAPTALTFMTGTRIGPGGRAERMRIDSSGNVKVNNLAGTGNAYACINANGVLFRSATPCN